jgi:hypothetical protein
MSDETRDERQVSVKALKYHTAFGEEHEPGAVYSVAMHQLDNLLAQKLVEVEGELPAPEPPAESPA